MAALVAVVVDVVVTGAISGETGSIEEEVAVRTESGSMSTGSRCCWFALCCLYRARRKRREGKKKSMKTRVLSRIVEIKERRRGCRYPRPNDNKSNND